jgi:hypothetical protein
MLHMRPTSILCVVDWGSIPSSIVDEADAAEDAATTATVEGGPSEELQERSRAPGLPLLFFLTIHFYFINVFF